MMAKSPLSSGRIIKVKKVDPPKSDRSLPATEPVFNFVHYLVWFGNHPKPKKIALMTFVYNTCVRYFGRIWEAVFGIWNSQNSSMRLPLKHRGKDGS